MIDEKKCIDWNASSCYSPNKQLKRALRERKFHEVGYSLCQFSGNRTTQTPHAAADNDDDPVDGCYCEWLQIVHEAGAEYTKKIPRRGEGTFKANSKWTQPCVYCNDKSSHWATGEVAERTVCAGIRIGVIAPFFHWGHPDSRYLELVQSTVVVELNSIVT